MAMTDVPRAISVDDSRSHGPRGARLRWQKFAVHWLPLLATTIAGIAIWQLSIHLFGIPGYMLPSPDDLLATLWTERGALVTPTWVTVRESYSGFLIAVVVGIALALLMAGSRLLERGTYPYLVLLQTMPIVAVAPLFVVWFGAGQMTNMAVAAMMSVFPVAASTLQGLKSTDRNLVDLYRMAGAGPVVTMFQLRFPAAVPEIMTGLRIAAGASVIGAIVGEYIAGVGGGDGGLGYVLTESAIQLRTAKLFAAVVVACAIALVLFGAVVLLERMLLGRWHESAMAADE